MKDGSFHIPIQYNAMARRKISNTQAVCILLLWFLFVYMLLQYSPTVDFMTVFTVIASGIIVFVPLYKNRRHKDL